MQKIMISALVCTFLGSVGAAQAGCVTGAIVGGVAGHMVGHGKIGAAAGCAVGHHETKIKKQKQEPSKQ